MTEFDKWNNLMRDIVDSFGVSSAIDNVDETNSLKEEGIWFSCPCCGEPILMADWTFEEVENSCPICECIYDEEV